MSREEYINKYIKGEIHDFVIFLLEKGINFYNKKHESLTAEQLDKIIDQFFSGR